METIIKALVGKTRHTYIEVVDGKTVELTEEVALKKVDDGLAEIIDYVDSNLAKDKARSIKRDEINAKRDLLMDADITFGTHVFDCNAKSRALIDSKAFANLVRTARGETFTTGWVDKHDNVVTMSPTELEDLGLAMESQYETALFVANTHKKAVKAKQLVSTIEAYDFSSGW